MDLGWYIDRGIMLQALEGASKRTPITLDNGVIKVGSRKIGTYGVDYTIDCYDEVVKEAYKEEAKQ